MRAHIATGAGIAEGPAPVVIARPAPRDVWRQLLVADPDALPTQSPEWLDSVCGETGAEDASRLYALPDGRQIVMPLVRRTYTPAGPVALESMPAAWGFGGPIADGGVDANIVWHVLRDLTIDRPLRLRVRPNPLHAAAWDAATRSVSGLTAMPGQSHVIDLGGGFDTVWSSRFRPGTRTSVRKAERDGLTIVSGTSDELVAVFYELFERSLERWARFQHEPRAIARRRGHRRDPRSKLVSIAATLGEACRILVAYEGSRPVAAIIVLFSPNNAHYTRGAMDDSVASCSPANRLLHKVAIEDACRRGCGTYHMGESGRSHGLAQFKSMFGARAHPTAEYWIERLPVHRVDKAARALVKRWIGFRDA